ncbi:MAG: hypothetical protein QNL84_00620 [Acidimicrobiia bacterium]|jgi:hypothetical protein
MFLGQDLLAYLVLALGGAMCVGNVLAIVRPPSATKKPKHASDDLDRAPITRTVTMAIIGGVAAAWALVSLLSG